MMPRSAEWLRVKGTRAHRKVGALLQRARRAAGLTQMRAAYESQISYSFISQCENGYYCISIPMLVKLAKTYQTTAPAILEGLS